MKKFLTASLAVLLCTGLLLACESKEENESASGKKEGGSSLSQIGNSTLEYRPVYRVGVSKSVMLEDVDAGMRESLDYIKEAEADGVETIGYLKLILSGDKFISDVLDRNYSWSYYDGTYSIEDDKIHFYYENKTVPDSDMVVNINDDYGDDERSKKAILQEMQSMNETGTYIKTIAPSLAYNDKSIDYNVEPFFINTISNNLEKYNVPVYLISKGDFLCVPTYGFELNGDYSFGNDFKINFNQQTSLIDDPASIYNIYKNYENDEAKADEYLEKFEMRCEPQFVNGEFDTTIEFSDGEWKWYNADGELINNGKYQESKDYKGIVSMYLTDDSKNCEKITKMLDPLLFYIADDGEIYYPGYVKMN